MLKNILHDWMSIVSFLARENKNAHLLDSVGTDVKKITSTALADAIEQGDADVEELVRNRAGILGIVLSNMVDFLNPEMIVLGGGLVDAMPTSSRRRSRLVSSHMRHGKRSRVCKSLRHN
jgi:predicted NBD/HSP70 family sugar kinase